MFAIFVQIYLRDLFTRFIYEIYLRDLFTRFIYDHRSILVLVLLPVLFVAMYVGQHLHVKINDPLFNQVVSGLSLAIKSVCLMV